MVKKRDLILAGAFIILGVMLTILIRLSKKPGSKVVLYINGIRTETYSLKEEGTYFIETEDGKNSFRIEDGTVRMEAADCPDQVCIHMGRIESKGETIVCLPHKVVLQIEGGTSAHYDIR